MKKSNFLKIKHYSFVLISIFILTFTMICGFFFYSMDKVRINGAFYNNIKNQKDLKIDIFPPPLYIVDTYLLVHKLVGVNDVDSREQIIEKIEIRRNLYYQSYNFWQDKISNKELVYLLIEESDKYVNEFFHIYDFKISKYIETGELEKAKQILEDELENVFRKHQRNIEEASLIIERLNNEIEVSSNVFSNRTKTIVLIIFIGSVCFFIIISYFFYNRIKGMEKNILLSKKETEIANDLLKDSISKIKRFKHNFDNILAGINGYILKEDLSGLKVYIDEIVKETKQNDYANLSFVEKIKIPSLTGLFLSKLVLANNKDVNMQFFINEEISQVPIKVHHICELLGVLIDNAIEASSISNEKKVWVDIENLDKNITIEIKNTVERIPDKNKIFEKGYTTKENSEGIGLALSKKMLSNYDNATLSTYVEEKKVTQELILLKK